MINSPDSPGVARHLANEQEVEVRAMLKHDIPVFNHPFRVVAQEYLAYHEAGPRSFLGIAALAAVGSNRPDQRASAIREAAQRLDKAAQEAERERPRLSGIIGQAWARDRQFKLLG